MALNSGESSAQVERPASPLLAEDTSPLHHGTFPSDKKSAVEQEQTVAIDEQAQDQVSQSDADEQKTKIRPFSFILTKHFWIIFVHGQILSFSIVATNTFSTFLAKNGASMPAFQSLFNYCILALIFTPYTIYKRGFKGWLEILYKDGWKYFLFAFADVQGNYFVVKAYIYTNMLSAALLDNFAIVVVVGISFVFFRVRYHWTKIIGIVSCIAGMALLVVSDHLTDKDYAASDMVKGDLFVLLGAACYGISNTLEEVFVSKKPLYEVVGQLGFWGMFIIGVQGAIFDRESIANATWSGKVIGYFVGYTLALLVLYLTAPILFRMSSAAFYNLSLLTSDFWSLLIGIRVFGYYVYWLYPVGFVFTVLGMIIYYSMTSSFGEAIKPWLGENQEGGVVGVGTAKRNDDEISVDTVDSGEV